MSHHSATSETYARYWEASGRQRTVDQVGTTCLMLLPMQMVFSCLDAIVFPEHLEIFTAARMSVNAFLVLTLFWLRHVNPRWAQNAILLALGGEILLMIYLTGGPSSDYYVGLIILCVGMPVLLPIRPLDSTILTGLFLIGFIVSPLVIESRFEIASMGTAVVFIASGCVECIISSGVLMKARLADYLQREEVERARDHLKEMDQLKSRFTANIHHELRTPLTLTLAPVEAMLSGQFGEISELQRGYLKTIQSNGLRLLKLINNLLDLAKIEGQQLSVTRRPVRLQDLVDEIVSGARPLAERKGVELVEEELRDLPVIHADPEAFEKIIVNLLGNALKFTERGGRITISALPEAGDGVHLVVADTGAGIPADQLERIFDRFAQVDSSSTRKHEGTGIGLALVKELVELHDGRIWAESEGEGRGAQMHLWLPPGDSDVGAESVIAESVLTGEETSSAALGNRIAAMGADIGLEADPAEEASQGDALRLVDIERHVERSESAAAAPSLGAVSQHPPETPEVLVADDNVDMRRLLAFLVGQEFRLRVARNGREALERVRERAPDLVLTDIMMPEMSGTELCSAIKGDPKLASIPVMLVTSKADRQMKIEGLELGADDYVTKPFHPRELMARVRSLVKLHRVQEELGVRNALLESTNEELNDTMDELKEASAQLLHAERLAAVGELAAGVAHEVNNPVNFALNAVKALQATVDDVRTLVARIAAIDAGDTESLSRQIEALQTLGEGEALETTSETLAELTDIVTEGLERTAALVGDLRDFAGPGERERTRVDVTRGLRTTLRLLGHTFMRAGIEIHADFPPGLPPVEADARALNQVFLNLLKNAAEAFEGQGGSVWIEARLEGDWVVVEIRDDGPGVPEEVRERLFQPFFTTKGDGRGTGLGLSISRRIVEEHGGRLELYSAPDRGTRLVLTLPLEPGPERATPRAA